MQFTDTAEIVGTRRTGDGYLVASVLCARTGCQDYSGAELGLIDRDVVTVHRPKDVVFDRKSLQSYPGKPVTIDHPRTPVTAETWKDVAVGDIVAVVPEGEYIRADIKIMDEAAIADIENGKREISMGYSVDMELKDGVSPDGKEFQAEISGVLNTNHLAIVDRARGGAKLRIGDDAEGDPGRQSWGASPLTDAAGKEKPMTLRTIVVDGLQVETTDAGVAAIEKLQKDLADAKGELSSAQSTHATELADKDKEIAAKDAEIEKLNKASVSDADLDAKVEARAALVDTARSIHKDVEVKGLSDADIRKAVVSAKLGDAAIADKSEAYIEARFDVLAEDAKLEDGVATVLKKGVVQNNDFSDADKAYSESVADLSSAWKGPEA